MTSATTSPDLNELICDLSRPEAYGGRGPVKVIQTHISVVFLVGEDVYKVKKPLDLGFLDYSTLELRKQYCEAEVELNRRLAAHIYVGVVPIVRRDGRLRVGEGDALEYAVHMRRLPDERTLGALVARGELEPEVMSQLGRRLAGFHAEARRGPEVSQWAGWDGISRNCWENFNQIRPHVGETISRTVFDALRRETVSELDRQWERIQTRADRDLPCDTHGDLRLEHVYVFPDGTPPEDLVIVDCVEFNDRFRYADPAADLAFLVMDLVRVGRRDLADALTAAYVDAAGDGELLELLPLYVAYRATVRGKVCGMLLDEPEVPAPQRAQALQRARGHFLLALGELLPTSARPCLVMLDGSEPRTTELARELWDQGWTWTRSNDGAVAHLETVEASLFEGMRVLVHGSFSSTERESFEEASRRWCVPTCVIEVDGLEHPSQDVTRALERANLL